MKSAHLSKITTVAKCLLTATALSIIGSAHSVCAQTFTNNGQTQTAMDNFNRADVAYTSTGSAIGTGYVVADTNAGSGGVSFGIMNNALSYQGDGTSAALLQENLTLGANYSIADTFKVNIQYPTVSGRLIFGYQDPNNYYEFQVADSQTSTNPGYTALFKITNGNESILAQGPTNTAVVQGTTLTLGVVASPGATDGSESFNFSVYSGVGTSGTSIYSGSYNDNTALLGGYAGLNGTSYYPVTEFDITSSVPEPATNCGALLTVAVGGYVVISRRRKILASN